MLGNSVLTHRGVQSNTEFFLVSVTAGLPPSDASVTRIFYFNTSNLNRTKDATSVTPKNKAPKSKV